MELGAEETEAVPFHLLYQHPIIQDCMHMCQRFKTLVSAFTPFVFKVLWELVHKKDQFMRLVFEKKVISLCKSCINIRDVNPWVSILRKRYFTSEIWEGAEDVWDLFLKLVFQVEN